MEDRFGKFTLLINNINRYINKIKSEEMAKFGLKSYHVSCLFYLYKHSDCGLTASELCSLCDEDKGTVSRSLSYLQDNGYIRCDEEINKKKYRAKLFLTKKGFEISDKINTLTDKSVELGSKGITDFERENMYNSLDLISNNLKNLCDNYGGKNGN